MNSAFKHLITAAAAAGLLMHSPLRADEFEAEDDAFKMAKELQGRQFVFSFIEASTVFGSTNQQYRMSVDRGIDYVLLVGRDGNVDNIDVYIYSEDGTQIVKDDLIRTRGSVRWRSLYSGDVVIRVSLAVRVIRDDKAVKEGRAGQFVQVPGAVAILAGKRSARGGSIQNRNTTPTPAGETEPEGEKGEKDKK